MINEQMQGINFRLKQGLEHLRQGYDSIADLLDMNGFDSFKAKQNMLAMKLKQQKNKKKKVNIRTQISRKILMKHSNQNAMNSNLGYLKTINNNKKGQETSSFMMMNQTRSVNRVI